MTQIAILIPAALFLGLLGLAAFVWSLRTGQYDDMEGAASRILDDDDDSNRDDGAALSADASPSRTQQRRT